MPTAATTAVSVRKVRRPHEAVRHPTCRTSPPRRNGRLPSVASARATSRHGGPPAHQSDPPTASPALRNHAAAAEYRRDPLLFTRQDPRSDQATPSPQGPCETGGEADQRFSGEIGKDQVEGPPAGRAKGTLLHHDPAISPVLSNVLRSNPTGHPVGIQGEDCRCTKPERGNRQEAGSCPQIEHGWLAVDG